jgi:NhaP-type Na+/H+ or K+/H+ antiporter
MVVLVAADALIEPSVLGLVSNPLNGVGAQLLFNIGLALILFHGGTGISLQVISRTGEIIFISWCRETGVIPAAVPSLLLARGVEGAEIAVSMVALAVCVTLLLQATTAGYVARRLDLLD